MNEINKQDTITRLIDEINLELKLQVREDHPEITLEQVISFVIATAKQREYTKNHQKKTRVRLQELEKRLKDLGEEI